MAPLKSTVVRDFSGGLNVVDDDLNLSATFQPVLDNVHRGVDNTLSIRWGTELFADLRRGSILTGTATFTINWTIDQRELVCVWYSHGLVSGDHVTFTVGWTNMLGLNSSEIIGVPMGVRVIDANNFRVVLKTKATATSSDSGAKTLIKDTHFLAGDIIEIIYYSDHLVVFDTVGEIVKINAAMTVTRIWDHSKAFVAPGSSGGSGWSSPIDYVSTAIFKGQLIAVNGIDKPLLIDFSRTPNCQFLSDEGDSFNIIHVPVCRYVCSLDKWLVMAGDPLEPWKVHISNTNSSGTWEGAPAPNDACTIELNNTNSSSLYIRGINKFRNLLAVAFDDTVSMVELGIFDSDVHRPETTDSVARHGAVAHKSMVFLGFDLVMADPVGVPSFAKSQFDSSIIPSRMSEFIAPMIQKNISRLTAKTLERDIFSVYSTHDNRYILFAPNHDDVPTPLPNDPIYYLQELIGTTRAVLHAPNHGLEVGEKFRLTSLTTMKGSKNAIDLPNPCIVKSVVTDNVITFDVLNTIVEAKNWGGDDVDIIRMRTEMTAYALTYNKSMKIKAWSRYKGWDFTCGTTSLYGRVFLAKANKIWRMGNRFDPIYADYKGEFNATWANSTSYTAGYRAKDNDTNEVFTCLVAHTSRATGTFEADREQFPYNWDLYEGVPINFAIEFPWADFDKRDLTKITKTLNVDAKGRGRFTVQMFLDYYYKHKITGEYTPQLSMDMVAGDEGGYGVYEQTYGAGRLAIRQRPWPFESRGKLFKLRIQGAVKLPLKVHRLYLRIQNSRKRSMSGAVRETTRYFDFEIPQFDFPGWHVYYDRNIKTVDTILYLMTGTDSLKGIWKNNELYNIGDRVVDIEVAFAYECFVAHTSPPAPTTFAQSRAANPNYWHAIDFIQALSGTSPTSVTIGLGTKVFQTQTGRVFIAGAKIIINSAANPTVNYMWGSVISYTGNTLTVDVDVIGGSGTHSDWLLSVSGERGAQGIQGEIGLQGPDGPQGIQGEIGPVGPQGIIEEAPTSGSVYGRNGLSADWEVVSATSASVLPITPAGGISSTTVETALYELDTEKVAKAGSTMTGLLVLSGDPAVELGAATKRYTDTKLGIAGGTVTGDITISKDWPALLLKKPASGTIAAINSYTGNNLRWSMHFGNNAPETGSNFGSHFILYRFNDAGDVIDSPISIDRSNGFTTLSGKLTINAGGLDLTGDALVKGDVIAYRPSFPTTGVYFFGNVPGTKYLYYDGTKFELYGGALYTAAISTQGNSLTSGPITCSTINTQGNAINCSAIYPSYEVAAPYVTAMSSDGLRCTVPAGNNARLQTTVSGVRTWTAGTITDGKYAIADESVNAVRYTIDTAGNHSFSNTVYAQAFSAPNFYGTLNGNITGGASYATNAGTATNLSGGSISMGDGATIEGVWHIDFKPSGHSAHDYCGRIIVHGDHRMEYLSAGSIHEFGQSIKAPGFRARTSANDWHFNWDGTLKAFVDGNDWGSVLNAHSDYRMKKDVVDLESMWDTVKALRPVKYTPSNWEPYSTSSDEERWGFIAHELQDTMIPFASSGVKDGEGAPQQPNWPVLVAALTKALQEAMARIEALEANSAA